MLPSDILRQQIGKANAQFYKNVVLGNPTRTISAANPQNGNFMASRFTGEQEGSVRRFYVSDFGMPVSEDCCGLTAATPTTVVYASISSAIVTDPSNLYLYTVALSISGPSDEVQNIISSDVIDIDYSLLQQYITGMAVYRVLISSPSTTPWTKVIDLPANYICDSDPYVKSILFSPDGNFYFLAFNAITKIIDILCVQNLSGTPTISLTGLDVDASLTNNDQLRDFVYFNGYLVVTINSGTGPMPINNIYMYKLSDPSPSWTLLLPNPPILTPFNFTEPYGKMLANSNILMVGGSTAIYLLQDSNITLGDFPNNEGIVNFTYDTYNSSNIYGTTMYREDLDGNGFHIYKYTTSPTTSNFSNLQSILTPKATSNESPVSMNVINSNFYIITEVTFYNSNYTSNSWYSNNPPPRSVTSGSYQLSDMINFSNASSNYLIFLNSYNLSPTILRANETVKYDLNAPTVPASYTKIGASFTYN
jgi:hypothetical protein